MWKMITLVCITITAIISIVSAVSIFRMFITLEFINEESLLSTLRTFEISTVLLVMAIMWMEFLKLINNHIK